MLVTSEKGSLESKERKERNLAIHTTDVRSNANSQIIQAAELMIKSETRRNVFKEIYRGKKKGKTADEISIKINIPKMRVYQEALILSKAKIIKKQKIKGKLTYLKDDFFSLYK